MTIKAILADLGNVVVFFDNAKAASAMGALLHRSAAEVNAALFDRREFRRRYQRGDLSSSEFLRIVCARLQVPRADLPDEAALGAAFADVFSPNAPVIERLTLLRKSGLILAAVSNVEELRMRQLEREGYLGIFDEIVTGCQERLLKPSQEFMVRSLDRCGVSAEDALFVDDDEDNLPPAAKLGINVHRYQTVEAFDACLESYGL